MTSPLLERRSWSRQRWCGTITLVFLLHVALLFWLGSRGAASTRQPASGPGVRLAETRMSEWMALNDPTLFALPSRHGFSGEAWLSVPPLAPPATGWTEAPRWLALQVEKLGTVFGRIIHTNVAQPFDLAEKLEPTLTPMPEAPASISILPQRSKLRIEGDLKERPLQTAIEPPSWPHTDILIPTVVRVAVGPRGFTETVTVLSSSGSREADQRALELARAARFEPLPVRNPDGQPPSAPALTWGRLVFDWHTTAMPAAPSVNP